MSDYQYLLSYSVLIIILMFIAKTKVGYNAIYYGLALFCIMLVLTQYKFIVAVLAPVNTPQT